MEISFWSVLPFVGILLCIAILPLVYAHWWHQNVNKLIVSIGLSIPVVVYLAILGRMGDVKHQILLDYIPFLALLGSLFYISGGIVLRGNIAPTAQNNTVILGLGSILASLIGTTGASMLLIRPLLRNNETRRYKVHTVIFFIFCVSNIGGLLTPLGDPPLFLGYLRGVPFEWTLKLFPEWLVTLTILLTIYYFWDRYYYKKDHGDKIRNTNEATRVVGGVNFLLLMGVVLTVAFVNEHYEPFRSLIKSNEYFKLLQVIPLLVLCGLSYILTNKTFRKENKFHWHPILEVAALFLGIFVTMIPALILLKTHGASLGIDTPFKYFWATGLFSSFLDNAPTYVVFLTLAQGSETVAFVVEQMPNVLAGISLGAVFMGANTYIGNAPNFMVKAVAEDAGIKMPTFLEYMIYSIAILMPVFALVSYIFLILQPLG